MNKQQTNTSRYYGILILLLLQSFNGVTQSNSQRIDNIQSFAKIYGYVRYFHPSDEAAKMNWNRKITASIVLKILMFMNDFGSKFVQHREAKTLY